jgi:hypothetical protein
MPGANPTTFEFTATPPALYYAEGKSWRLGVKMAPTPMLDLALFVPRHEVGAYASLKIWSVFQC